MRPQHITAENAPPSGIDECAGRYFNEAAAYHCGKLARRHAGLEHLVKTSMRPQHITAENITIQSILTDQYYALQ